MIRAEPEPLSEPIADLPTGEADAVRARRRKTRNSENPSQRHAFHPPALVSFWAKVPGRAGESDALFSAGASLALLDAFLRRDPPCGAVLRQRLALQAAAASAKILRLRADEAALRDLRFAATADPSPAAKVMQLWRDLARRPPALDGRRLAGTAASLDLALPNPDSLFSRLKDCAGQGDPVSAAARTAALAFAAVAEARPADAEVFALWAFDLVLATRLRWERPLPLIATKVLDPAVRPPGADRRPRPTEADWTTTAAAGVALAAATALDLGAELSRRADTLLTVAPRLRARPARSVIEMLLAEDSVSSPEAAGQAKMTDRSARRLFERLVKLGAVRELSGRETFRMFGL